MADPSAWRRSKRAWRLGQALGPAEERDPARSGQPGRTVHGTRGRRTDTEGRCQCGLGRVVERGVRRTDGVDRSPDRARRIEEARTREEPARIARESALAAAEGARSERLRRRAQQIVRSQGARPAAGSGRRHTLRRIKTAVDRRRQPRRTADAGGATGADRTPRAGVRAALTPRRAALARRRGALAAAARRSGRTIIASAPQSWPPQDVPPP